MRGTIERRGPTTWRLRVYVGRVDGKRRWKSKTIHGSKSEADQQLARFVLENAGRITTDRDVTFAELVDYWHDERTRTKSPATVSSDTSYRAVVVRHLGDRHIRSITAADVESIDKKLERDGYSSSHRGAVRRQIVGALNRAVDWGMIASNPTARTKPPPVRSKRIDPPTVDQIRALINAADKLDPATAALVRIAATVGPRRGELCGLRFDDVTGSEILIERTVSSAVGDSTVGPRWSPVEGAVSLYVGPTKTGKSRRVAIDESTRSAIDRLYDVSSVRFAENGGDGPLDGYLFSNEAGSVRPWHPSTAGRRFLAAQSAAGLSGFRIHDLRHGVATRLIAAGVDPVTVAGRLGHASPKMTLDVYSHFVPANDSAAADLLADQLR